MPELYMPELYMPELYMPAYRGAREGGLRRCPDMRLALPGLPGRASHQAG
jgi:hypothetical protein